jgi:hypothetical protein
MKAMLLNRRRVFHLQTILTLAVDQTATIKAGVRQKVALEDVL